MPIPVNEEVTPDQVLTEWVEALRSDDYEQGHSYLATTEDINGKPTDTWRYCCLGVLCEVGVKHGLLTSAVDQIVKVYTWPGDNELNNKREDVLPIGFALWLGITVDPTLHSGWSASQANDDEGWSFEEIANAVENHLIPGVRRAQG